jgi:hypothetical protein
MNNGIHFFDKGLYDYKEPEKSRVAEVRGHSLALDFAESLNTFALAKNE